MDKKARLHGAILFSALMLVGVGWVLKSGRLETVMPAAPTSGAGTEGLGHWDRPAPMSHTDYETSQHGYRGAVVGHPTWLSGDRLIVQGQEFRLWGIREIQGFQFCADTSQGLPCGTRPIDVASAFIGDGLIACYERAVERDGTKLAQCYRGVMDVGGHVVEMGFAFAQPNETHHMSMKQGFARGRRHGYWAGNPGG